MSEQSFCDPACVKLLLCAGCAGYGLLVQDDAQKVWIHQGNALSPEFRARQSSRIVQLRLLINAIFARIGHPLVDHADLNKLGHDLLTISKQRGLSDEDNAYAIERADECEDLVTENQDDYLQSIGYVAA